MARPTLKSLQAENDALRDEIRALRFTIEELRAARVAERNNRMSARRLAMEKARAEAVRTGKTVPVSNFL
jgi:septal ring factor EnvC (AmiA/AmiB activator)